MSRLALVDDAGPTYAPAARSGVGFSSARCTRYRLEPGGKEVHRATLRQDDHLIRTGDQLTWVVLPAFDREDPSEPNPDEFGTGGFGATGVAIDLLLDDGTRMSERRLRDHHGQVVSAAEQGRSRTLSVDQWNRRCVDLSPLSGRRVVAVEVACAPGGTERPCTGWIDAVEITPSVGTAAARGPLDYVLTTRGTQSSGQLSRGNTAPATALPNGFHVILPVTDATSPSWPYSYHSHVDADGVPALEGFGLSHAASPWLGDRGVLQFFPTRGSNPAPEDPAQRRLRFRRENETARPHRYSVVFEDGTSATIAPTLRAGLATVTFPHDDPAMLFRVDQRGALDMAGDERSRPRLYGYSDLAGTLEDGSTRCYFVAELDRPVRSSERRSGTDDSTVLIVRLDAPAGSAVTVRFASSFLGIDQAERNLEQDLGGEDDVESVADRARAAWEELLGRFTIRGATDDQLVTFYSSLYRLYLYPSIGHEMLDADDSGSARFASPFRAADGPSSPTATGAHVSSGTLAVNNGFWDTYRTAWPAYSLFARSRAGELLDGFVRHFQDGGWMSRWSAPGYVNIMVGTSSDVVVADAVVKGVPLPDALSAYDSALKDATVPSEDERVGRKGLERGLYCGYIDTTVHEGMSWSMENAVNDAGIATLSEHLLAALGDHPRARELAANAHYFRSRAAGYAHLFDPEVGFFQGRGPDGRFRHDSADYDPRVWGGDYTETNGWGMAFTAPHDPLGLAALYGGLDALESRLDRYFREPEHARSETQGSYGTIIHEMTEARNIRMGMFALSNQPAHHVPYLYAYTRSPHKTHAITRDCLRRHFLGSEIGQGYPGDEDNGELSAWYIFNALGFYPLAVGSPWYVITAPLFDHVEIELESGARITVTVSDNAPGNDVIQSMRVNGQEWDSPFISHETLAAGCRIETRLGPEPSGWGRGAEGPSLTASGPPSPLVDLAPDTVSASFPEAAVLVDDSSASSVGIPVDGWVEWSSGDRVRADLYTVTAGRDPGAAPTCWRLEASDDAVTWVVLDERRDEMFRWPRQVRPFLPERTGRWMHHRIVFGDAAERAVSQLELLTHADPARWAEDSR